MAGKNLSEFNRRVKHYAKTHKDGPVPVDAYGKPVYKTRMPRLRLPWGAMVMVLTLAFALKAFIVLRIGEDQYRNRLAALDGPGFGKRVGKFVMQPDPLTLKLRDLARPIIGQ